MKNKILIFFVFIVFNCFSQDQNLLGFLNNHINSFKFNFLEENKRGGYKLIKVDNFDFESFMPIKASTKRNFYFNILLNDKDSIIKISRYSKDEGYGENYDILVSSLEKYKLFTQCIYKDKQRDYKNASLNDGVFVHDKKKRSTYYIKANVKPIINEHVINGEKKASFETINITSFPLKGSFEIFYLNKTLKPKKELIWYNNGLEFQIDYTNKQDKIVADIYFISKYRCEREILLSEISLKELARFFMFYTPCDRIAFKSKIIEIEKNSNVLYPNFSHLWLKQ
jgi:hypothetical protein